VDQARRAGRSWTEIGERLGVSKQAARKRFPDPSPSGVEIVVRPRLDACLDQARRAAQEQGSGEVDTQHLLLGLLHVGVAAAALDRLGVGRDQVRTTAEQLFGGPPVHRSSAVPALSEEAECALAKARTVAREHGHGHLGTEHLLVVLATDPGSHAGRVLTALGVSAAEVKRELEPVLCRARRRRRFHRGSTATVR
jgi:ATP-dependent Clp protease ATP-binding subunit ClpA